MNGDAVLLVELDAAAREHLRIAIDDHVKRWASHGYRIPPALHALSRQLAASSGQERPTLPDRVALPHPEAVLLTYHEAGDRLGLSDRSVRRLVADGELRAVPLGSRARRVTVEDLDSYVRSLSRKEQSA